MTLTAWPAAIGPGVGTAHLVAAGDLQVLVEVPGRTHDAVTIVGEVPGPGGHADVRRHSSRRHVAAVVLRPAIPVTGENSRRLDVGPVSTMVPDHLVAIDGEVPVRKSHGLVHALHCLLELQAQGHVLGQETQAVVHVIAGLVPGEVCVLLCEVRDGMPVVPVQGSSLFLPAECSKCSKTHRSQ